MFKQLRFFLVILCFPMSGLAQKEELSKLLTNLSKKQDTTRVDPRYYRACLIP